MGWAENTSGEVGDGTFTPMRLSPTAAIGVTDIIQVSRGGAHTLFLKADGTVWATGFNYFGQIGIGTLGAFYNAYNTPQKVLNLTNIVQVSAGSLHSLALKSDGTVWSWGHNGFGQLGDESYAISSTPTQVHNLSGAVQIAALHSSSLALKSDGTLWVWGYSGWGQLALNATTLTDKHIPIQVKEVTNVVQIWKAGFNVVVLTNDGTLWGWGDNYWGQLGIGEDLAVQYKPIKLTRVADVVQVASANNGTSMLFLRADGTAWGAGTNTYGEVLESAGTTRTENGQIRGVLSSIPITGLSNIVQVASDGMTSFALKQDGTVLSWGYNKNGNLGDGTTTDNPTPKPIPGLSGINYIDNSFALIAPPLSANFSANTTLTYAAASLPARLTNKRFANPLNWQKVRLQIDGQEMGSARTNANGIAKAPLTTNFDAGTHTATLLFDSSPLYKQAKYQFTLTINRAPSTLSANNAKGAYGSGQTLKALVKRRTDGKALPNETVNFKVDGNLIGTTTTDGTGTATLMYLIDENLSLGVHTLLVEFAGGKNHLSSSFTGTITTVKAPTKATEATLSGNAGTTVVLKAVLRRTSDSKGVANRSLLFSVDGIDAGSAATDATGKASLNYTIPTSMAKGSHKLSVTFAEDGYYLASSDKSATLTVK